MSRCLLICLLPLVASAAYAEEKPQLPNPAAVYCIEKGGKYEIRETGNGQVGICVLPDGTEIDAWDLFRTENQD